jgi:hypothetical protein
LRSNTEFCCEIDVSLRGGEPGNTEAETECYQATAQ